MIAPAPSPVALLAAEPGASIVDLATIDAFLAGAPSFTALIFTGEGKKRPEAQDVAVVARELLRSYRGGFRCGVVADQAEDALKQRFGVIVLPTVVLLDGAEVLDRIPRMQDWSIYAAHVAARFGLPPRLAAE
jgi:hydrogenase-1 operon protein HyaE